MDERAPLNEEIPQDDIEPKERFLDSWLRKRTPLVGETVGNNLASETTPDIIPEASITDTEKIVEPPKKNRRAKYPKQKRSMETKISHDSPESSPSKEETTTDMPAPGEVREMVSKAVAEDLPVEGLLERSHEVKDDPKQQSTQAGAASVNTILTQMRTDSSSSFPASLQTDKQLEVDTGEEVEAQAQKNLYHHAIKRGVQGGLIIIALIVIITAIRSAL